MAMVARVPPVVPMVPIVSIVPIAAIVPPAVLPVPVEVAMAIVQVAAERRPLGEDARGRVAGMDLDDRANRRLDHDRAWHVRVVDRDRAIAVTAEVGAHEWA
jgi:hypothetical protein